MQYTLTHSKTFWTLSFISVFFLLFSLILQVNYFARDVFTINDYQNKLSQLSSSREGLEINLARSTSLKNIEDYLENKNFKKANQVKYIQILEPSVAKTNEGF